MTRIPGLPLSIAFLAAAVVGAGCTREESAHLHPPSVAPAASAQEAAAESEEGEHGHVAGAHGGRIVSLGGDTFHAEAVFERGGTVRLFTLGSDETIVLEVDSQELIAFVAAEGDDEWEPMTFRPDPQPGDSPSKTSQFAASLPEAMRGRPVEVTIPSISIAGERYRMAFASGAAAEHAEMPAVADDDAAKQLYLTAGGLYTEADIAANGRMTAAERFQDFKAAHDLHPAPGDRICPVTLTKANAECTWIIGGKTYEFCCPPCVDEFLRLAKENPDAVQAPETYVK